MDTLYYGKGSCAGCNAHTTHSGFSNVARVSFSREVMQGLMERVYDRKFDTHTDIDRETWREVLHIMGEATIEGLSQSGYQPAYQDRFLHALRHGNEVFAAFKVHTMGEQMAAKLLDEDGNLKPFSRWAEDVASITTHHVGHWLRTEYDTAVIRAHNAADWQEFERNKDVMPNLRWMPTTSPEPESTHATYWRQKLTLPVDDPFWDEHHPGDRWNCKCSLEQTDEPVCRPAGMEPTQPQRGLENNPGKDGHIFNQTHPYFPTRCSQCAFYQSGGIKERLLAVFQNRRKDCYNCPFINGCLDFGERERKKHIKEGRALYKELKTNPEYRDVHFDPETGGVKATHRGHNTADDRIVGFGMTNPQLERECQEQLYKMGHRAILLNEKAERLPGQFQASLDLDLDGRFVDIKSHTTARYYGGHLCGANRQIGNFKRDTGTEADGMILYFHDPSAWSPERLQQDIEYFKRKIEEWGSHVRIRHIHVLVNGSGELLTFDI